jgi:hypothetical protein
MSRLEIPELIGMGEFPLLLAVESADEDIARAGGLCYLEILFADNRVRVAAIPLGIPGARMLVEELEALDIKTSISLQRVEAALAIHKPCHTSATPCAKSHDQTVTPDCLGCGYNHLDSPTDWPCDTAQALGMTL